MGVPARNLRNIDVWNLRGAAVPMDKLAPKLIRRAQKRNYIAVIIDPIYKVITGDENSADQMARFCNQFDLIASRLGCAVIYCHHHSKGAQGGKRSMDRASGSGVFGRDPDALLDMIQLELSENAQKFLKDNAVREALAALLDEVHHRWRQEVSQDDMCSRLRLELYAGQQLHGAAFVRMAAAIRQAEKDALKVSAWRMETTLREFAPLEPINVWFDYPLHRMDDTGILNDLAAEEAAPPWQKGAKARKKKAAAKAEDSAARFADAVSAANLGEPPTVAEMMEYLGLKKTAIYDQVKKYGYEIRDSRIYPKSDSD